jgi:4-amino-4-deoxy-L-arabinose transferase-like glycosyltransferase
MPRFVLIGSSWAQRRPALAWSIVLLVIICLIRVPSFCASVISPDESAFALAAREVAHGFLPYLTFFDIKPVGSTLLIAAVFKVLGANFVALRLVGLLSVWASAVLLTKLSADNQDSRSLAVGCSLLYVGFSTTLHGLATMTEIVLTPFAIGSVILLMHFLAASTLRRQLLLAAAAGLLAGIAILIKIVPVLSMSVVFGVVLLVALWTRRLGFIAAVVAGAVFLICSAAPMALTALVYWRAGHFAEFMYANFGFSKNYVTKHPTISFIVRELFRIATEIWPLILLALIALARTARDILNRRGAPLFIVICFGWLAGEVIASVAPLHFSQHYFLTTLPPLCILAMEGIRILAEWIAAPKRRARVAIAVAVALVPVAPVYGWTLPAIINDAAFGDSDLSRNATAIIKQAAGGQKPTLWVTSQEFIGVYLSTGADLPTPYAQPEQLIQWQTSVLPFGADGEVREVRRILASRPEFILIDEDIPFVPPAAAEITPVIASSYREIAHLPDYVLLDFGVSQHHDLHIYRLSSPSH